MYKINEFLIYYNSLKDVQKEIEPGVWVNCKPLPFYYGLIAKKYWGIRLQRLKDAWQVLRGNADAVEW